MIEAWDRMTEKWDREIGKHKLNGGSEYEIEKVEQTR